MIISEKIIKINRTCKFVTLSAIDVCLHFYLLVLPKLHRLHTEVLEVLWWIPFQSWSWLAIWKGWTMSRQLSCWETHVLDSLQPRVVAEQQRRHQRLRQGHSPVTSLWTVFTTSQTIRARRLKAVRVKDLEAAHNSLNLIFQHCISQRTAASMAEHSAQILPFYWLLEFKIPIK